MECQDEKPIIYTMENKPIVTCECYFFQEDVESYIFLFLPVSKPAICISFLRAAMPILASLRQQSVSV